MTRNRLSIAGFALWAAVVGGCAADWHRPQHNPQTITPTPTTGELRGHPVLAMPISIPNTEAVLVPLTMQSSKGLFEDDDPYTRGGLASLYSRSAYPGTVGAEVSQDAAARWTAWNAPAEVRWHNVIACGEGLPDEPVLVRRGVIGRWQMFGRYDQASRTTEVRGLLFIAVIADTNTDGSLDNLDARIAIVTDGAGRGPRMISPVGAQVLSAVYNLERDSLFLQIVQDTNRNGRFDPDDDPVPYEWKIRSEGPATPLVSEEAVARALRLLR